MIVNPVGTGGSPIDREQIATEDCPQKNVRVSVYDDETNTFYEIPTVDSSTERDQVAVEVQVRKDGPGALTRLSDIYFPAVWKGEDVFNTLPLSSGSNRAVPVQIETRPYKGETWQTVHYGWLRKIGSGGDGRLMRMRVDDYVKILQTTQASKSFNPRAGAVSVSSVLEYVEDALDAKGYSIQTSTNLDGDIYLGTITGSEYSPDRDVSEGDYVAQSKTFEPHRDTLVDVLNWLVGKVDGSYWYVEYDDNRDETVIKVGRDLQPAWVSKEIDDDGITIRKNLALTDLNPVNTVSVTGQTGKSIAGIDIPLVPDSDYPVAKVRHKDLYERSNERENSKQFEIEERTLDAAVSKAKDLLREEIGGAGEASMVLNGNPSIVPFGTIKAKPVCDVYVQSSVDPMTYGIERVTHEIPATGTYTTTVDVGVQVRADDVEVVESQTAEVSGTEGTGDDILQQPVPGDDSNLLR